MSRQFAGSWLAFATGVGVWPDALLAPSDPIRRQTPAHAEANREMLLRKRPVGIGSSTMSHSLFGSRSEGALGAASGTPARGRRGRASVDELGAPRPTTLSQTQRICDPLGSFLQLRRCGLRRRIRFQVPDFQTCLYVMRAVARSTRSGGQGVGGGPRSSVGAGPVLRIIDLTEEITFKSLFYIGFFCLCLLGSFQVRRGMATYAARHRRSRPPTAGGFTRPMRQRGPDTGATPRVGFRVGGPSRVAPAGIGRCPRSAWSDQATAA